MNYQFRKKPVVIEAFQMTKERRANNSEWPTWLNHAWQRHHTEPNAVYPSEFPVSDGTDKLKIHTLEGEHLVEWGDYIIQGVKGDLSVMNESMFLLEHDEVKEDDLP